MINNKQKLLRSLNLIVNTLFDDHAIKDFKVIKDIQFNKMNVKDYTRMITWLLYKLQIPIFNFKDVNIIRLLHVIYSLQVDIDPFDITSPYSNVILYLTDPSSSISIVVKYEENGQVYFSRVNSIETVTNSNKRVVNTSIVIYKTKLRDLLNTNWLTVLHDRNRGLFSLSKPDTDVIDTSACIDNYTVHYTNKPNNDKEI